MRLVVISCLALLVVTVSARAQTNAGPPVTPDQLAEFIERLDDASLAERESAEDAVAGAAAITLHMVEARMGDLSHSVEQRLRLERIASKKFAAMPKAGMGVRFGRIGGAVTIATTVPGFASAELLEVGDIIIAVDGEPISDQDQMRAIILSCAPDDVLLMSIRRAGQGMVVALPLGSYTDLRDGAMPISTSMHAGAYRERLRRIAARTAAGSPTTATPTVGSGLGLDAWRAVERGSGSSPPTATAHVLYRDRIASLVAKRMRVSNRISTLSGQLAANDFEDAQERANIRARLGQAQADLIVIDVQLDDLAQSQP